MIKLLPYARCIPIRKVYFVHRQRKTHGLGRGERTYNAVLRECLRSGSSPSVTMVTETSRRHFHKHGIGIHLFTLMWLLLLFNSPQSAVHRGETKGNWSKSEETQLYWVFYLDFFILISSCLFSEARHARFNNLKSIWLEFF